MSCARCEDRGFIIGHENRCYERGDCSCAGVQIQCPDCDGTGDVKITCGGCTDHGCSDCWPENGAAS